MPKLRDGAMRMLKAAAQFYPKPITKSQCATWTGFSVSGGTFNTYLSELKRAGWITETGETLNITQEGLAAAGPVEPLPTEPQVLIETWASKFREGAAKMLRAICSHYPGSISRNSLGEEIQMAPEGGTFGTYLSELRSNGLVIVEGEMVRAHPSLFLED